MAARRRGTAGADAGLLSVTRAGMHINASRAEWQTPKGGAGTGSGGFSALRMHAKACIHTYALHACAIPA